MLLLEWQGGRLGSSFSPLGPLPFSPLGPLGPTTAWCSPVGGEGFFCDADGAVQVAYSLGAANLPHHPH